MKTKLTAILAITVSFLWPLQIQSQQPLKHFGYIEATTDSDLNRVRSYTDFTFVAGEYEHSIVDLATRVRNNGMRTVIDLGRVLWCPGGGEQNPSAQWHLCFYLTEVNYWNRWNNWVAMNGSVLNSNYVLAFSVITEPTLRGISTADVETAVALVKRTFPQIPTLVEEAAESVSTPDFAVPSNADWIGISEYCIHPNLNDTFKERVRLLKQKNMPGSERHIHWMHSTSLLIRRLLGLPRIWIPSRKNGTPS